jgi:hypothetical protein
MLTRCTSKYMEGGKRTDASAVARSRRTAEAAFHRDASAGEHTAPRLCAMSPNQQLAPRALFSTALRPRRRALTGAPVAISRQLAKCHSKTLVLGGARARYCFAVRADSPPDLSSPTISGHFSAFVEYCYLRAILFFERVARNASPARLGSTRKKPKNTIATAAQMIGAGCSPNRSMAQAIPAMVWL